MWRIPSPPVLTIAPALASTQALPAVHIEFSLPQQDFVQALSRIDEHTLRSSATNPPLQALELHLPLPLAPGDGSSHHSPARRFLVVPVIGGGSPGAGAVSILDVLSAIHQYLWHPLQPQDVDRNAHRRAQRHASLRAQVYRYAGGDIARVMDRLEFGTQLDKVSAVPSWDRRVGQWNLRLQVVLAIGVAFQ